MSTEIFLIAAVLCTVPITFLLMRIVRWEPLRAWQQIVKVILFAAVLWGGVIAAVFFAAHAAGWPMPA